MDYENGWNRKAREKVSGKLGHFSKAITTLDLMCRST